MVGLTLLIPNRKQRDLRGWTGRLTNGRFTEPTREHHEDTIITKNRRKLKIALQNSWKLVLFINLMPLDFATI